MNEDVGGSRLQIVSFWIKSRKAVSRFNSANFSTLGQSKMLRITVGSILPFL